MSNPYKKLDHYSKKAKSQGFAARSIFKLEEIHQKFNLLKSGQSVLDLGYSPGSWTQFASKLVGPTGRVIAIDLKSIDGKLAHLKNTTVIQADALTFNWGELPVHRFDCILSDMAPNTTGQKDVDQARSLQLAEVAAQVANKTLKPGGHLVIKIFESQDAIEFEKGLKSKFKLVKRLRPKTTRKQSKEYFLVLKDFQSSS